MVQATILVDEWRSFIQSSAGVGYVKIPGALPMATLSAVSWVSLERMRQDMMLIMVVEVDLSCLFVAMAGKNTFGIVLIMDGINKPVYL